MLREEVNTTTILPPIPGKSISHTHEGNVSNTQMEHISYLLTGRINIVNTSILATAIYIFTDAAAATAAKSLQSCPTL